MADPGFEVGLAVDKAKCGPNRRAVAHEQSDPDLAVAAAYSCMGKAPLNMCNESWTCPTLNPRLHGISGGCCTLIRGRA